MRWCSARPGSRSRAPTGSPRPCWAASRSSAPRPAPVARPVPVAPPPPEPPRWFLESATDRYEIRPGTVLSLGRLPGSGVVLTDPQASGQHAELQLTPAGPVLIDVGSRNGTF